MNKENFFGLNKLLKNITGNKETKKKDNEMENVNNEIQNTMKDMKKIQKELDNLKKPKLNKLLSKKDYLNKQFKKQLDESRFDTLKINSNRENMCKKYKNENESSTPVMNRFKLKTDNPKMDNGDFICGDNDDLQKNYWVGELDGGCKIDCTNDLQSTYRRKIYNNSNDKDCLDKLNSHQINNQKGNQNTAFAFLNSDNSCLIYDGIETCNLKDFVKNKNKQCDNKNKVFIKYGIDEHIESIKKDDLNNQENFTTNETIIKPK